MVLMLVMVLTQHNVPRVVSFRIIKDSGIGKALYFLFIWTTAVVGDINEQ